jgi:molybdopterin-guanine dinucleotide biosynthesis adapter protein
LVFVIAAVGTSGSGKTTTIEYLIKGLSVEGFKIGSIKHVHREGFTIDKEGTNTWRYAKAGSKLVVAISPEEIAIIKKTDTALKDLDQVIELLKREKLDIIFIEGFRSLIAKRKDILKIVTAKDEANLESTLDGTSEPILAVTGVIAKNKPSQYNLKIPIIDLDTEGTELLQLVRRNIKNWQTKSRRQDSA